MQEQNSVHDKTQVLHVLDKFSIDGQSLHGVARLMSWWVNAIDHEHFELNILGLRGPSEAGRHVEQQGGQVFYSDRGKLNPASILDILQTARRTETDILHLHGYKASTLGRIAGAILGIPVILHEHAAFPDMPTYQKALDRLLAPLCDRVVVNCQAVADFCVEHRSVSPEKLDVVFNGIPLDDFREVSEDAAREVADEFGLKSDAPIVGTVARLDEQKGLTYLLNAVPAITADFPEAKVLVVGDGTLREELEEKADRLGITQNVIFTGERRDVPRLYKLMDVKVISSIYEGTTLTVFEAMAAGTPVVATRVDGVKEVIDDSHNGKLVEPRSSEAIANTVVSLLKNEERRRQITERAKQRVREYDVRTSMRQVESIYRQALS